MQELHLLPELHPIVVQGLCATNDWKRALTLPKPTSNSLNILARKVLRENDIDSVWNVMNGLTRLPKHYQYLSNRTIGAFVKYFGKNPKDIPKYFEKLMSFL